MKNTLFTALGAVFLLGMIDQIEDGMAVVEITDSNYDIVHTTMPVTLFPCEVSEGDFFYFANVEGVTEIRCGEPNE